MSGYEAEFHSLRARVKTLERVVAELAERAGIAWPTPAERAPTVAADEAWPHRCEKAPWRGGHIAGVVGATCSLCGQTREESEKALRAHLDARNVAPTVAAASLWCPACQKPHDAPTVAAAGECRDCGGTGNAGWPLRVSCAVCGGSGGSRKAAR